MCGRWLGPVALAVAIAPGEIDHGARNRHKAENAIPIRDPRGFKMYWIGPAGPEADAGEGTDFHAVKNGYVSISPMQTDMTKHDFIDDLEAWADKL